MRVHLEHVPDLHEVDVLAVTERDDLVERGEEREGVREHLTLVRRATRVGHDARDEVQRVDVLRAPR